MPEGSSEENKRIFKIPETVDAREFVEKLEEAPQTVMLGASRRRFCRSTFRLATSAKEGYDVVAEDNVFVVLETALTPELIAEGYMREFVSKIQQMRKSSGFQVSDKIRVEYDAEPEVVDAVETYRDYIAKELLAVSLTVVKGVEGEEVDLNEKSATISIRREEQ